MKVLPFNLSGKGKPKQPLGSKSKIAKKRVLTEPDEGHKSQQGLLLLQQQLMIPLIQKAEHFSTIFTKRKRTEYSGYKQNNLNKSKFIQFKQQDKKTQMRKPLRNFETNNKNIARLRRRFSCQAHSKLLQSFQSQSRMFSDRNMRTAITEHSQINDQNHVRIRQILKKMIDIGQPMTSHKISQLPQINQLPRRRHSRQATLIDSSDFSKYAVHSQRIDINTKKPAQQMGTLQMKKADVKRQKKRKSLLENMLKTVNKNTQIIYNSDNDLEGLQLSGWQDNATDNFKPKPSFFYK